MKSTIKGIILDENNQTIPSATVFLSDEKGNLLNEKARVLSDANGNYSLPISIPIPNPLTGVAVQVPIGKYVTVKYSGYPDKTVAIKEEFFKPTTSGFGAQSFQLTPKTKDLAEVTVTANKAKFDCEKGGGTWDETTKTCKLPQKNWWGKYKWWVIGGLALTATATTLYVVLKRKK